MVNAKQNSERDKAETQERKPIRSGGDVSSIKVMEKSEQQGLPKSTHVIHTNERSKDFWVQINARHAHLDLII